MSFEETTLKELLGDKGYIRGPFGSALRRGELKEAGVPVYEQQHAITGTRDFRFYIDDDKYQELKRFTVKTNDLIISCSGTVGRISVIEESDPKGIISQALLILRPDAEKILPYYLYYFFTSKKGFYELINASQGAVQLNIAPRAVVEKIPILVPSIEEQQKIVAILKSVDDKIYLNRQINQTLEQIAQAIFKSWFVDFEPVKAKILAKEEGRDPERAAMCAISGKSEEELDRLPPSNYEQLAATAALFPDELEESERGEIPKGWEWKVLYDTAEFINGSAFNSKDFSANREGLPIVKIVELKFGISEQTKFTTGMFPEKSFIDDDDVLYSWSGSPETSLEVFKWFGGKAWLNQHIFKINFNSKESKYFVYFLLKHLKSSLIQIATNKQTTGLGHVTVADMRRINVVFPGSIALGGFAKAVGPLYERSSETIKQNMTLYLLRDAMIPKLLSGGIDLKEVC